MPHPKVWRSTQGEMFHDACFEEGESREGYTEVKLSELMADDSCESCGGVFLSGLTPAEVDDDDSDDDDEEDEDA